MRIRSKTRHIRKTTIFVCNMDISPAKFYLSESLTDSILTTACRNGIVVLLVTQGNLLAEIDGHDYHLEQGNVVTLLPTHTLTVRSQSNNAACRWVWFAFDFMTDFPLLFPPGAAGQFGAHPVSLPAGTDFIILEKAFGQLADYYGRIEHPIREGLLKAQLFIFISELLACCADCVVTVCGSRAEILTDTFFALLHRYYATQRSLLFYADRLCITTKYLSKIIRRTTGQTVYYWIEEFIVKEAKRQLRSTDATVTEIADRLGFPNSSFFAKLFRRHTSLSPNDYRHKRE